MAPFGVFPAVEALHGNVTPGNLIVLCNYAGPSTSFNNNSKIPFLFSSSQLLLLLSNVYPETREKNIKM